MGGIFDDSVKLIDVARGMIMFSSNANTEFLMDLLGFQKVNHNIELFGLKKHSPIYPMVSSLLMYQNPKNFKEEKILKEINKLSEGEYAKSTMLLHDQMKEDSDYKNNFRPEDLTFKMQKIWSDRLPSSTTKDYVRIGSVLNDRKNFNQNTFGILAEVLETMMESPANQNLFLHAGMKGGSTIFVLTKDLYATLKNGTRIELAYFFNDLSQVENLQLQSWMNDFELKILTDESFRKRMKF
jgi:D-alanyl-D-alanine carboxypeptidase